MNYGFIVFIELIDTQMVMYSKKILIDSKWSCLIDTQILIDTYRYPPKKTTAQRCTGPSAEDCHDGNHERGVALKP